MIPAALFLVLLLTLGYLWHRDHTNLQATIDDQAETAAEHVVRVAELEGTVDRLRKAAETANDSADRQRAMARKHCARADGLQVLLIAEQARNEYEPAIRRQETAFGRPAPEPTKLSTARVTPSSPTSSTSG